MKRLLSALSTALIAALSLCSCGQTDDVENKAVSAGSESAVAVHGGEARISTEVYENITVTIFRSGDYYTVRFPDDTGKGWSLMNFRIPDEITLEDGEFGTLTTDVKYTYGGDQGIAFRFENVTSFERITAEEARKTVSFEDYAPSPEERYDMYYNEVQVCHTDGNEYMLMRVHDGIHVYLDGKPFGVYNTPFEMEAALGLRHPIVGDDIRMDEARGVKLFVFRCGDVYLSYSTCVFLNDRWTPVLDENFNNLPMGFSLEDGEMTVIKNTDILIVNGGDGKYVNAPMLTSPAEAVKLGYYEAFRQNEVAQWTDGDNSSAKEGDFWEYSADDYNTDHFILFLDGRYLVYHDNGKEQYLKNVYYTADEVSKALGISDE